MTSFHELERSGRAERSYPTYVRDRTPAWIAGLVALAAISGFLVYEAGWITQKDAGAALSPAATTALLSTHRRIQFRSRSDFVRSARFPITPRNGSLALSS